MTPTQYRKALKKCGLTVFGAGRLLGVNGRTSQRWAAGDDVVPTPVKIVVLLMLRYGATPEDVGQLLDGKVKVL